MAIVRRTAGEALRWGVAVASLWLVVSTFVAVGWLRPVVVAGDSMAPHARRGDRVWVDRLGAPKRWDAVVVRSPTDAQRLIVKRLVGLPRERVAFVGGDLSVGGRVIAKGGADRTRLRVPVDVRDGGEIGWVVGPGWTARDRDAWSFEAADATPLALREPVTDGLAENAEVSRRLNVVNDLEVELDVALAEGATLRVACCGWAVEHLPAGEGRLRLSTFDRTPRAWIDGREVEPAPDASVPVGVVRLTARGVGEVRNLRLWRDVYYEASARRPEPILLGPGEWLLVGDNQAVSIDGRNWSHAAGTPRRLLVGVAAGL